MTRAAYRLDRRTALRAAAACLAGPLLVPLGRRPRAQTLDKVSFQTDWRAQAEHGGYYQAIAAGLYKAGIECDLRQGGPSLNISQLLLAGRVDMIMSNSFEAFTYVRERRAVLHHRRDLPEGSAGADRPSRHGLRRLREAEGPHRC